jgi:ECF sigma factor
MQMHAEGNDGLPSEHSVSNWLKALGEEPRDFSARIWNRYVGKLVRLARKKLMLSNRRVFDEEDIVLQVFTVFLSGAKLGRFKRLNDRNDLWQILGMLTERKVISHFRREKTAKRGNGTVRGESAFMNVLSGSSDEGISNVVSRDPTPEFSFEVAETLGHLLGMLETELLRSLVRDNLAGYTPQLAGYTQ